MVFTFRSLALTASAICLTLACTWLFLPGFILQLWDVPYSYPVAIIGKRSAALFFCIAIMFFGARNAEPSQSRSSLSFGFMSGCFCLSALGLYEFFTANAGVGILAAVFVELALALSFLCFEWVTDKK